VLAVVTVGQQDRVGDVTGAELEQPRRQLEPRSHGRTPAGLQPIDGPYRFRSGRGRGHRQLAGRGEELLCGADPRDDRKMHAIVDALDGDLRGLPGRDHAPLGLHRP
jgi:hypothetical protein